MMRGPINIRFAFSYIGIYKETVGCHILICLLIFVEYFGCVGSQNNVVGIATCCRLDVLKFELWWGRDSLYLYTLAQRHTQAPVEWVLGALLRG